MKGYFLFPKYQGLEPHHQMLFSDIYRTLIDSDTTEILAISTEMLPAYSAAPTN